MQGTLLIMLLITFCRNADFCAFPSHHISRLRSYSGSTQFAWKKPHELCDMSCCRLYFNGSRPPENKSTCHDPALQVVGIHSLYCFRQQFFLAECNVFWYLVDLSWSPWHRQRFAKKEVSPLFALWMGLSPDDFNRRIFGGSYGFGTWSVSSSNGRFNVLFERWVWPFLLIRLKWYIKDCI